MRRIAYRYQRTLAGPADVTGVGFITGTAVRLRVRPAAPHTGVVFARADLPGTPLVPARVAQVTDTRRRTTLGPPAAGVTLVEHVLAALAGLRIDNCQIELDGPEPPGLDGSALGFVRSLSAVGAVNQPARRPILAVTHPVVVCKDGASIGLHPATDDTLRATYTLDYGLTAPIPRQAVTVAVRPDTFARELAGCRTFLLKHEAELLRAQGIGKHLSPKEVLVFDGAGPIDNRVRFADEPARHKLLDLVGDLSLCGFDLAGHVVAYRSGHSLNVDLATRLSRMAESAGLQVFKSSGRACFARAA